MSDNAFMAIATGCYFKAYVLLLIDNMLMTMCSNDKQKITTINHISQCLILHINDFEL